MAATRTGELRTRTRGEPMGLLIIALIACALALPVTSAWGAETLVCDDREAFKGGGWRHARLALTLEEGMVAAISYGNGIASGKEGGRYLCAFDASAADGTAVGVREMDRTRVELKGERNSTFSIEKSTRGYTIRFLEMSPEYCGFGAEFPQRVRLDRGVKKCRVTF